jgi:hypothetical protein
VSHYSRISAIVFDVPAGSHGSELDFWQAAVGQHLGRFEAFPDFHGARLHGQDIGLLIQELGDGPARVHVDIHTDDLEAEVARLEQLGAERVRKVNRWFVMRDPAGLLFCVVPDEPGTLTDDNAHRWD